MKLDKESAENIEYFNTKFKHFRISNSDQIAEMNAESLKIFKKEISDSFNHHPHDIAVKPGSSKRRKTHSKAIKAKVKSSVKEATNAFDWQEDESLPPCWKVAYYTPNLGSMKVILHFSSLYWFLDFFNFAGKAFCQAALPREQMLCQ